MKARLGLERMKFKAFHGYYSDEKKIGGEYELDVFITYDIGASAEEDELRHAIDYENIYAICEQEMNQPQKLIETLAYNILSAIDNYFENDHSIEIYLRKLHPPIIGQVEAASIRVSN